MDDDLLSFSGEMPEDFNETTKLVDAVFTQKEVVVNVTMADDLVTTFATLLPYSPNYYRIAALSAKCALSLLVLVLSATIKRDFLKVFTLFLILPIVLECGFDVYSEIKTSITYYGSRELLMDYYRGDYYDVATSSLQHEALKIYQEVLARYTTYNIYSQTTLFALVCYILSDILFWSTLFTSVVAFYYAHKAIVRPEEINYIPYVWSFLRVQLFPILFTLIDTLLAVFTVPTYVLLGATVIIRLAACLVVVTLVTQTLASFVVFCRRRDEYTKSSPYDQVRDGKWRLFWFICFQITIHVLSVPYITWAAISLAQDVLIVFNIPHESIIDAIKIVQLHAISLSVVTLDRVLDGMKYNKMKVNNQKEKVTQTHSNVREDDNKFCRLLGSALSLGLDCPTKPASPRLTRPTARIL
ncbi:unnamed protein product [Cylicocyclus nassatus]|uniref:Uncharacterized protein n=1 Tax=Cylicocyclus nassatus TaxID=53992 RepID=A0AA36GZS4_CYLNA|nr:unnamed protein product [Cylicocyclus nassatus]